MATCPRCGKPQPENTRYCTGCGHEEECIHRIWEKPVYRDWEDPRIDDFWDRPFITVNLLLHWRVWSKGQFLIALALLVSSLAFTLFVLSLAGYWVVGALFVVIYSPFFVLMYLLYRKGEENLRWSRAMGTTMGGPLAPVEAAEAPETLMRNRRI